MIYRIFFYYFIIACINVHGSQCISKTHWFTEPSYQALGNIFEEAYGSHFSLQTWYVGSRANANTINNSYFLLPCHDALTVMGDTIAPGPYAKNIRAEWLGLPSDYRGMLEARPSEHQHACVIAARYSFSNKSTEYYNGAWWIGITGAWQQLTHDLIPSTLASDLFDALNNPTRLFGKWPYCIKTSGLAHIRLYLGKDIYQACDTFVQIAAYAHIPTQQTTGPVFLFQPTTGFDGHWGWGFNGSCNLPLFNIGAGSIGMYIMGDNIYLFKHDTCRLFDLYQKPLSRLMLSNGLNGIRTVPTGNTTTLNCSIHPYNRAYIYLGFLLKEPHFSVALCYAVFGRSQEKIVPRQCLSTLYGIAGTGTQTINNVTVGNTASASVISYQSANDTTFTPYTLLDIELKSAQAPSILQSGIHARISGHTEHLQCTAGLTYLIQQKYGALSPLISWLNLSFFW
jgi:hypothetical protein